ncbi:DUF3347 domain-containing protein [Leeuwenhoekiella sp. H156]|uniref:DUF3347 domain-containing protein n=1 Tax=Leeuwenhoekiella sp. H156 TaxID=3450128 RepID=UPI003FA4AAA5
MKNTVKFVMIAATALSITSCGNDKKNNNEGEDALVEERMVDEQEMEGMDHMDGADMDHSMHTDAEMKTDDAALSFEDENVAAVWKAYNSVRLALIASDPAKAKQEAANLAMIFDESNAKLKSAASAIASSEDLKVQRTAFSQFSNAAEAYFKGTLNSGTLYKQHCPMAFDGKGGDWLSNEAAIKNPYYGDQMLTCGSVTATITK